MADTHGSPLQHGDLRIPVLEAFHQRLDLLELFTTDRTGLGHPRLRRLRAGASWLRDQLYGFADVAVAVFHESRQAQPAANTQERP